MQNNPGTNNAQQAEIEMRRQADLAGARRLALVPQAALAGLIDAFPRPHRLPDAAGASRSKISVMEYCFRYLKNPHMTIKVGYTPLEHFES
jgi:hypothetical protein